MTPLRPCIIMLVCALAWLTSVGCGGRSAEKTIIGKWEFDRQAHSKAGGHLEADVRIAYEFKADGTGMETLGGAAEPATWKVVSQEGSTVVVDLATKADKSPRSIRITVLDADHLKIYNSHDFGECPFMRSK